MKPERWQQVREVLHEAMQMDEQKRSAFLDSQCATDPSLRAELNELLAAEGEIGSNFLESPALAHAAVHTDNSATGTVLATGTKLGPYVVQALIGAGGMGEVYSARDASLKRDVAIKVLPASLSRDPDRLRRFQMEAEAAAALNHPNILSIYAVGQQDGSPYIVTELLHGETLRDRLRHGPLRLREALDVGIDVARGLAAAHDAGVVHRDLKPENIFVTKDGRVKILDLGLAKLNPGRSPSADDLTAGNRQQTDPGRVLGTVGYMSPEQVRGESADARSDIFAAGAVLYEMLTGKRAFHKATSAETMSAILNEDPPAVSQVAANLPLGLQRIVNRCLSKNLEQRIQHATDLAFALEALSNSGSGGVAAVKQQISAKRWIWIAGGVAAIAIAAAIFVWWELPPAVPVVESVTQLTDDGERKLGPLLTDGSRIYFNEEVPGRLQIAQVAVTGGPTAIIPTTLASPHIMGLAPEGSEMLASAQNLPVNSLWKVPLPAGECRRLAAIEAQDATFSPDGHILFAQRGDLYLAEKDGANPRKLLSVDGIIGEPSLSQDGRQIVLTIYSTHGIPPSIVEFRADGSGLQTVANGREPEQVCCARWTPDGKYVVFGTRHERQEDLWVVPMKARFFQSPDRPVQLTNGPLSYTEPVLSRNGRQVFAIGTKERGELVRYDVATKQFVSFLSGLSAVNPTFSKDGRWVAYTTYPDHTLWRSRIDGTDRLQLTYPPMRVYYPFISPDGNRVVYGNSKLETYVISMEGGQPQRVVEKGSIAANWSRDGSLLVFTDYGEPRHSQLQVLDLLTGKRSVVPGSRDLYGGQWVADEMLVAAPRNSSELLVFDPKTQKWSNLVADNVTNWSHSPDLKYLYYTTWGADAKALRVRISDHKVETITGLKHLRRGVGPDGNTQVSVAPDGSPVFTRDIGSQEIYALTIKWP